VCELVVDAYGLDAREFSELRRALRILTESVNAKSE
jgi:hypothetical protein